MAAGNVTPITAAKVKAGASRKFNEVDRDIACLKVSEALAVCRIVKLATAAQMDRAVDFFGSDPSASRWLSSIDPACERLREVRTILCETSGATALDWFTPLNLLEALGAAMWHCSTPDGDAAIGHDELQAFMRVAIASLDQLADGLRSAVAEGLEG